MSFTPAVRTFVRWFDRYTLEAMNVPLPVERVREPVIRALEDPSSIRSGRSTSRRPGDAMGRPVTG